MGSKPKKSEYKPTETERVQAAIAAADERYFRQTYDPLLVELRDKAAKEDVGSTLRGRAQADTYQALTGEGSNYGVVKDIDTAATLAVGATGQLLDANTVAKNVKVTEQVGVLGTARGQAADAGDALAQASKLARSESLTRAKAKQDIRIARMKGAGDIGAALITKSAKNRATTGSFLTEDLGYAKDPVTGEIKRKVGHGLLGGYKTSLQDIYKEYEG